MELCDVVVWDGVVWDAEWDVGGGDEKETNMTPNEKYLGNGALFRTHVQAKQTMVTRRNCRSRKRWRCSVTMAGDAGEKGTHRRGFRRRRSSGTAATEVTLAHYSQYACMHAHAFARKCSQ
jgi:hypothetical protein